jgi:processive rubber oxygenase RoxA-like protein/cytochrome c
MTSSLLRIAFFFSAGISLLLSAAPQASPQSSCSSIDLNQGWTSAQSDEFWFTSQGSRLMPYPWFLALEVADPASHTLIRDRSNMDRYGYVWVPPSARNPDGLPVGFVKDVAAAGETHVGFTCAACHTRSLNIGGKSVIVEGGSALADFGTFEIETVAALDAALNVPAKFDRFSKQVLGTQTPAPADLQHLRDQMKVKLGDLQTRLSNSASKIAGGYGRVDAFGNIFTRVLAQDLNIPSNAAPSDAPAKYPFLWDTPQHDVVQWNGSAPNTAFLTLGSLGRNLGEVFGVFGELQIASGGKFPFLPFVSSPAYASSANIPNLISLEKIIRTLWSPVWPKSCLPLADAATLERGKKIYDANCASCHRILGDPERKDPDRTITAILENLAHIGTDPTLAMNYSKRSGATGVLQGSPNALKFQRFGSEAVGRDMIVAAVNGISLASIGRSGGVPITFAGLMVNPFTDVPGFFKALGAVQTPRYKARPLDGIWATAPYLHNGSVPTLWDLLNPTSERPAVFYVGSHDFDPVKVGLVTTQAPGAFLFDTSLPGNWRNGHEYGTSLSDDDKKSLLEFLKTL